MLSKLIIYLIPYSTRHSVIRKIYEKSKILIVVLFLISSCSSVKQLAIEKDVNQILNQSEVFSKQFTGFSLYDIETEKFIASHNSTLKFTPASNTKLLTAYCVLKSFNDSLPDLLYQKLDTGLLIQPMANPTFLYEPFKNQKSYDLLRSFDSVYINWPDVETSPYGSGWAWDDYRYDYQAQISWWPIYGNTVSIKKQDEQIIITPGFFTEYVEILTDENEGERVERDLRYNSFNVFFENDTTDYERIIPFDYSVELLLKLLSDTLGNQVKLTQQALINPDTLYAHHLDTILTKMLKPSDNFLAEQLLLMAANTNGFSSIDLFIEHVKNTWLSELTDFVWVDGSGLSRYNLIAPVDQVRLLKKCYDEFGWDRMTRILPTGGEGTLEELYLTGDDEIPFIFGKTGTLSNNHSLSGYLVTKSGKRLIFSFMNNHYTKPTQEIKNAMEQFIIEIKNAY
ncbi:D-alanyl-D-alanine carboxypeptidase [Ekhidna sp.]|uniref:D-alanyl-D-alanine carboxypeptidase n=1 Tax=Ekhidna sp. TaxID=2608089 RepID=UPI003297E13F